MPLVFYDDAVVADAGNGVVAGLFLPIEDLPMAVPGEFAAGESQATKESKALLAIGTALFDYLSENANTLVGFSATKTQTSVATNILNWIYNFTFQKVAYQSDGTFSELPLPIAGTNAGIGGIEIDEIFPNAEVVSAAGAISGEGVLIPNSMILGGSAAALGADKRDYLEGLLTTIAGGDVTVRTAQNASAIIALTNPTNFTSFTLPAAATQATNPTTGIASSSLGKISTVQKTVAYTVQVILNDLTGQFDVHSVVS